ncbi:unnamed protein product [Paramecium octaurelia]|uniref:Uncharacterized protein n=1 Tax=Paramecium octaurelia TaxID=43137 RepID=A0A8S1UQ65_PAROT|nr:unnamed protein product [Paramecium octaurelia]
MQLKSVHQYYIKAKNQSKDQKGTKCKEQTQATASQISLILSKMNGKIIQDSKATSDRTKNNIQISPKLQNCLSASNLMSKTSQSPKLSECAFIDKKFAKECPSRINNEKLVQLPTEINSFLEMEERKRTLNNFKEQLSQNIMKIQHLDQLQTQVKLIEQQLHSIVQTIIQLKDSLCMQLQQEQLSYAQITQSISDSLYKMKDDIIHNEINIIESMQMKPFQNIMTIYKKRLDEHQSCVQQMIAKRQFVIQFNQWCQQLMLKLQVDQKGNFDSEEKENCFSGSNKIAESPKFRSN